MTSPSDRHLGPGNEADEEDEHCERDVVSDAPHLMLLYITRQTLPFWLSAM
jgi:hypothetical protein